MKIHFKESERMVKRLTRANILEPHAEAIANEILSSESTIPKEYLDLKCSEIIAITEARIEYSRAELLKWFIGIICIQTITLLISILVSR